MKAPNLLLAKKLRFDSLVKLEALQTGYVKADLVAIMENSTQFSAIAIAEWFRA